MSNVAPRYISSQEASVELGISQRRMQQLLASGRIKGAKRVGRSWIIPTPVAVRPGKRGPTGVAGERKEDYSGEKAERAHCVD